MLGVANAQLGTAILGLGAAQGMLMSSTLNTLASWVSFHNFHIWASCCVISQKESVSEPSRLLTSPHCFAGRSRNIESACQHSPPLCR